MQCTAISIMKWKWSGRPLFSQRIRSVFVPIQFHLQHSHLLYNQHHSIALNGFPGSVLGPMNSRAALGLAHFSPATSYDAEATVAFLGSCPEYTILTFHRHEKFLLFWISCVLTWMQTVSEVPWKCFSTTVPTFWLAWNKSATSSGRRSRKRSTGRSGHTRTSTAISVKAYSTRFGNSSHHAT